MTATATISCRDGCGRTIDADAIESSGWEFLPIQKRWRCPQCWRGLREANLRQQSAEARAS